LFFLNVLFSHVFIKRCQNIQADYLLIHVVFKIIYKCTTMCLFYAMRNSRPYIVCTPRFLTQTAAYLSTNCWKYAT